MELPLINKKIDFWTSHIEELINLWENSNFTSASVKKRYFSGKKYLGSKDKKIIGNSFYFYLRHKLILTNNSIPELLYLAYRSDIELQQSADRLLKGVTLEEYFHSNLSNYEQIFSAFSQANAIDCFPSLYLNNIILNKDELSELCKALNKEATTDIRIIADGDWVREELSSLNADYTEGYLPSCLKLEKNLNFNVMLSYKNGSFEIQDESSQLVSILLNPLPEENILDYCSGGGGKTLHLAELSKDKANITATDIDIKRLKETERRISNHKLSSVKVMNISDVDNSSFEYDKILIDAPCSGSGTVRRAPEIRYTIDNNLVKKYSAIQTEILDKCKSKLRSGGELIYSTCSLFQAENDDVIGQFLEKNPDFEAVSLKDRLTGLNIDTKIINFTKYGLLTLAHKTKTDGFFISSIRRK